MINSNLLSQVCTRTNDTMESLSNGRMCLRDCIMQKERHLETSGGTARVDLRWKRTLKRWWVQADKGKYTVELETSGHTAKILKLQVVLNGLDCPVAVGRNALFQKIALASFSQLYVGAMATGRSVLYHKLLLPTAKAMVALAGSNANSLLSYG